MFECLIDDGLKVMKEVKVMEGMNLVVERIRFGGEENGRKRKEILHLPAKILSTNYSNFYLLEIQSNYQNHSYKQTIHKKDFQLLLF